MPKRRPRPCPRKLAARRSYMKQCIVSGVRAAGCDPSQARLKWGIPWNARLKRCYLCTELRRIPTDRLTILERPERHRKWKCLCRAVLAEVSDGFVYVAVRQASATEPHDWDMFPARVWHHADVPASVKDGWGVRYNSIMRDAMASAVDDAVGPYDGWTALYGGGGGALSPASAMVGVGLHRGPEVSWPSQFLTDKY
jgi:hypothetical protein